MATIALKTANRLEVAESIVQTTLPVAEDIVAGALVRIDTATGKFTNANGTTAPEARVYGIATSSVKAGLPLTAIRKGVLDGYTLTGAYDAPVYLSDTDGRLDTAAGTVSVVVGRILPGTANLLGAGLDKLLFVDL